MLNKISIALLATTVLSGCVLEDNDNNDNDIQLTLGDIKNGVAQVSIHVDDHENLQNADIKISALMNMLNGMEHGTPISNASGTLDENGDYTATDYFLMPSSMGGEKMGDWFLNVELNGETKAFPIEVLGMSGMQKLQGDEGDQISKMDGTSIDRSYYIFNREIKSMAASNTMNAMSSLEVYIAARETMMNYSAVMQDTTLNAGDNSELAINSVSVSMCIAGCDTSTNWKAATVSNEHEGVYKTEFMAEATDGIHVKLLINGIEKLKGDDGIATFNATAMMDM